MIDRWVSCVWDSFPCSLAVALIDAAGLGFLGAITIMEPTLLRVLGTICILAVLCLQMMVLGRLIEREGRARSKR